MAILGYLCGVPEFPVKPLLMGPVCLLSHGRSSKSQSASEQDVYKRRRNVEGGKRTWLQLPIRHRAHGRSTLHARTVGGLGSCMQRSAVTGTLSTADIRCLHSTVRLCCPRSQLVEHSLHSDMSHLGNTPRTIQVKVSKSKVKLFYSAPKSWLESWPT